MAPLEDAQPGAIPDYLAGLEKLPYWEGLSSDARRLLAARARPAAAAEALALTPPPAPARPAVLVMSPTAPGLPVNVRVNNPGEDTGSVSTTQSEPSLAVSPPHIVVGFNDSNPVSSFSGYANSDTAGVAFTDDAGIAGPQSGDTVLTVNSAGDFYFAMLSSDAAGNPNIGVSRSTDHGVTFSAPADASTTANDPAGFQDKEWLTVDTTGGARDGTLYLAWTNFRPDGTAQIMFARSTDQGATWSAPLGLSAQGPGFGHQGAMPAVAPDGTVYVAWLDRATSQLLVRRSDDGGVNFANPVGGGGAIVTINQIPGLMPGSIRANSFLSIAVGPDGTVYVVYAARVGADNGDVFLVRSADQGQTWSAPLRVNDDATTNDQWMPSVAVAATGVVGVMFYDRRNDPANLNIDIYLALSTDGGQTFLANQRITDATFPPAVNFDPVIAANYMGDYNQMVAVGTRFYLAWGDNRDTVGTRNDPNVYFAIAGTEDCYVRDNPADDGTAPSTPGQAWRSPDILPTMNPSIFGTPNPVQIQVHNHGPRDAADVTVRLYWTDPATLIPRAAWRPDRIQVETSPGVFTNTNEQVIGLIPAGGMAEPAQPFIWDPPKPSWATDVGHFCLLAEIESAGDPLTFPGVGGWQTIERDNNLAVRNVHVQEVGGRRPTPIRFFIGADLEQALVAELLIDPRRVPRELALSLRLEAAIARHAKFGRAEILHRDDKTITLRIPPAITRITGLELAPKRNSLAEFQLQPTKHEAFKAGYLQVTQRVDGQTTGGLLYLLRSKEDIND
jgi:hypothetical protein